MLKKRITLGAVLGSAVLLMGVNLPSCPGQQAMQKQIDDLSARVDQVQKSGGGQTAKIQQAETEVQNLNKTLSEVAEVLKTHKATIEQLQAQVQELTMRSSASPKKKPAPAKKHH